MPIGVGCKDIYSFLLLCLKVVKAKNIILQLKFAGGLVVVTGAGVVVRMYICGFLVTDCWMRLFAIAAVGQALAGCWTLTCEVGMMQQVERSPPSHDPAEAPPAIKHSNKNMHEEPG